MTTSHQQPLAERLRKLLDMLREALQPRQPARIPVPARDEVNRRR